jgi:dTDP-4-dehydrorhamnose reductase
MTILVTGGRGQLGRSVARRARARGLEVAAHDLDELDICDPTAVMRSLEQVAPSMVINAAAYTAVDKAESERERAFAVNATAAATVARACRTAAIPMFHLSTDYVFDGTATTPYREDSPTKPLCAYGESKAEGERAVLDAGGTVIRTSWLFAEGGPGFVQTILRLATERPLLRVVDDQHGCPTWAEDLADAILDLSRVSGSRGLYHYCGDGVTTWYRFAVAILDEARHHRALACERIDPITTAEYPTPARRPAYSVLDTTKIRSLGVVPRPWSIGLAQVVRSELGGKT